MIRVIKCLFIKQLVQLLEKFILVKQLKLFKKELINTPEFIEKFAREELGLVAPDEIIFMEAPKNTSK